MATCKMCGKNVFFWKRDRRTGLCLDCKRLAAYASRRKCFATVSIRGVEDEAPSQQIELGEFHTVWKDEVLIGSDPGCTVVLAGLAPVAARLVGASHHILLYRLPEGSTLPLPPTDPAARYDRRVDRLEFIIGQYVIRFGEIYREA